MSIEEPEEVVHPKSITHWGKFSMRGCSMREKMAQEARHNCYEPRKHHPAVAHVLQYFACDHLPKRLQEVSRPFAALAHDVAARAPECQETTVALRKLLEAKDAAVRASLSVKDG